MTWAYSKIYLKGGSWWISRLVGLHIKSAFLFRMKRQVGGRVVRGESKNYWTTASMWNAAGHFRVYCHILIYKTTVNNHANLLSTWSEILCVHIKMVFFFSYRPRLLIDFPNIYSASSPVHLWSWHQLQTQPHSQRVCYMSQS